ncbi:MAG: pilus assembly PilX N-terminal domain-containing protein [Candidatus Anammoxibacter sp.]
MKIKIRDKLRGNDDGVAVIMALIILFIIAATASTSLMITISDLKTNANYRLDRQLFYVSEAGIYRTIGELCSDSDYGSGTVINESVGNIGSYTVTVAVDADPFFKTITSTGNLPDYGLYGTVTAKVSRKGPFIFAAYSDSKMLYVKMDATVDSYDSSIDPNYTSPYSNGDLGSNAEEGAGEIGVDLGVNSTIKGDVQTVGTIIKDVTANVTGDETEGACFLPFQPIGTITAGTGNDIPPYPNASIVTLPNGTGSVYGNVTMGQNGELTLSGGDYDFDELIIGRNVELIINGTTTTTINANMVILGNNVTITNNVSTTFNVINTMTIGANLTMQQGANPRPEDFIIYYKGSQPVDIDIGNGSFYGAIYAPNAQISLGKKSFLSHFYGSFIGDDVHLEEDAKLHYDESLADLNTPYGKYKLVKGSFLEKF